MKKEQSDHHRQPGRPQTQKESETQGILSDSFGIFYLLFFLSGLCALIYEIAWTRRLTLIFGNTVYSISTVLVAFMGGLALGSRLFGGFIDRRNDPIRVYAFLEIGIGVSALLLPFALSALNPVYRVLYNETGASNYLMSLVRFLMSAGILIVPTTMMGATLPVLSKFVVRSSDRTGANIGSLYAINTLGAVAGCFLAGFVLLGWIGMTKSEYLAASINIFVGIVAFGMYMTLRDVRPAAEKAAEEGTDSEAHGYSPIIMRSILLVFCLSGMAALAYEVLWSRILVFLLGSSIYSFSMILAVYLLGLTTGSLVFARFVDGLKKPLQVFGWLEILIGIAALTGLVLFQRLPFMPYMLGVSAGTYLTTNFINTIAIVLPPTLLMGAIFPLAVKIYARSLGAIGKQTGTLYAVNTVGAILGSFVAGFVLIPLAGSKNSLLLLVLVSMACGLWLLLLSMKEEGASNYNWLAAGLFVLPLAGMPFGNELMEELSVKMLEDRSGLEWEVVAFDEDATAAVAVAEDRTGTRLLTVNGISMTYMHAETQLMAHLPLALVQEPKNLLVVCFGMGTTFVSGRKAGMDVDFVELCPYVVKAFGYYHEDTSRLNEPGVGKIIADGRNYLLLSDKTYDAITIDPPPPPYSAGTVNLYTKEFYELCKQRLKPGGVTSQWIPMYSTTEDQYKMLLRTFMEVFPHTSVWSPINGMGTYLVGTPERLQLDRDRASFNAYFDAPAVKEDLALYGDEIIDGTRMLSLLLLDENAARYYSQGAPVMTDDLPLIEFPLFKVGQNIELMRTGLIYGRRAGIR